MSTPNLRTDVVHAGPGFRDSRNVLPFNELTAGSISPSPTSRCDKRLQMMQLRALNPIACLAARSPVLLSAASQEHYFLSGSGAHCGGTQPMRGTGMAQ